MSLVRAAVRNPIMMVLPSLLVKLGIQLRPVIRDFWLLMGYFQTERLPGDHVSGLMNGRLTEQHTLTTNWNYSGQAGKTGIIMKCPEVSDERNG